MCISPASEESAFRHPERLKVGYLFAHLIGRDISGNILLIVSFCACTTS